MQNGLVALPEPKAIQLECKQLAWQSMTTYMTPPHLPPHDYLNRDGHKGKEAIAIPLNAGTRTIQCLQKVAAISKGIGKGCLCRDV